MRKKEGEGMAVAMYEKGSGEEEVDIFLADFR